MSEESVWKPLDWLVDKMKAFGALCLVGMMGLTCADVVGRFFRHPIFGSVELVGFMATTAIAMGLPFTHKIGAHVGVELVVRLLSDRTQKMVELFTRTLSLGLFALITWRMSVYAYEMHKSGEVSMNLELPEYVVIYITAFCIFIQTLVIINEIKTLVSSLRRK